MNSNQDWASNFKFNDKSFWDLFHNAPVGIVVTNSTGDVLFKNIQYTKFSSVDQKDLIDFKPYALDDQVVSLLNPNTRDFKVKKADSTYLLRRIRPTESQDLDYLMWMVVEDSKAELVSKLSTFRSIYKSFLENTFEIILRTDLNGNILFSNRLFLRSFGYTTYGEIKGLDIVTIFKDEQEFKNLLKSLTELKKFSSKKIKFKKVNGQELTCLVNASIFSDINGNRVVNWTMLDISNQIDSETRMISKNDELAKLNVQMERFLYSTSHDLRSPITSILGLINLMQLEARDPLMQDYIKKVELSTLKLDKIIKDIMSFSKSSYQRTYSEKIDFNSFIWNIIKAYHAESEFHRIDFDVKTDIQFPFFADPERLEIIIENLIRNAIQFFDTNKSKPFIKVTIKTEKDKASIEILDNGIGIGQHHHKDIFKMFYKASHLSKGAGLGLFIVKETLDKIHGSITLESEIGFGTVIRLNIPNDHKGRLISRKLDLQNQS